MEAYWKEQRKGTQSIATRAARMVDFVTCAKSQCVDTGHHQRSKKKKRPELVVKSYILQETEACSRAAKIAECGKCGERVASIQHDGIFITGDRTRPEWERLARRLTAASRRACGYVTEVDAKEIPAWDVVDMGDTPLVVD